MAEIELLEVRPPAPSEEALVELFREMEKTTLATLDAGGRQIITLVTGICGLFFGVLAFKDAPAYLAYAGVRVLGSLALGAYFVALLLSLIVVLPRKYSFSRHSLTEMRDQLEKMTQIKSANLRRAHWAFGIGTLSFVALLIDVLVFRV